jgi:hypothetical protein
LLTCHDGEPKESHPQHHDPATANECPGAASNYRSRRSGARPSRRTTGRRRGRAGSA